MTLSNLSPLKSDDAERVMLQHGSFCLHNYNIILSQLSTTKFNLAPITSRMNFVAKIIWPQSTNRIFAQHIDQL